MAWVRRVIWSITKWWVGNEFWDLLTRRGWITVIPSIFAAIVAWFLNAPQWAILLVFFGVLFVAAQILFVITVRRSVLPKTQTVSSVWASPLRINFDEHDRMCVDKIMDSSGMLPRLQFIMFRVRVKNRGKQTVEDVRVLVTLRGEPSLGEVPLRFLLDTSGDGQASIQGYTLDPETEQLVNVVAWDPTDKDHPDQFTLQYAVPNLPNMVPIADSHGVDLVARGKNTQPFPRQFNLHIDEDGVPRLRRAAIDLTRPEDDQ